MEFDINEQLDELEMNYGEMKEKKIDDELSPEALEMLENF